MERIFDYKTVIILLWIVWWMRGAHELYMMGGGQTKAAVAPITLAWTPEHLIVS